MIGRFPRDRPVRESRMPENMRKQPHRGNGEGVDLHPLPYPLIIHDRQCFSALSGERTPSQYRARLPWSGVK
jgi:hypothetical protein